MFLDQIDTCLDKVGTERDEEMVKLDMGMEIEVLLQRVKQRW